MPQRSNLSLELKGARRARRQALRIRDHVNYAGVMRLPDLLCPCCGAHARAAHESACPGHISGDVPEAKLNNTSTRSVQHRNRCLRLQLGAEEDVCVSLGVGWHVSREAVTRN